MGRMPKDVENEIKKTAYALCEEHGYGDGNRVDSTAFIDMLLARQDVGGRLKEYLPASGVRVYIKDTLCGRYTKNLTAQKMKMYSAVEAIKEVYGVNTVCVGKSGEVTVCKEDNSDYIYLVDYSTLVRWESSLRRILEYIARTPYADRNRNLIRICLVIVDQTNKLTYADKTLLAKALEFVNAKPLVV